MSTKDKPGISLVGCGIISEVQAEAIQNADNAELVSVYSRKRENAERIGEQFQVPWSTDWDAFIQDEQVDIVSICTPSGNHLDYGRQAAKAGKHVVVEKPIEVTLERGRELIQICRNRGVRLAVIFQNRYMPEVQRLKRHLEAGELGDIFLASAYVKWYRKQEYYDSAEWRGSFALDGGGVLINQAIHTIDLLQWMVGEVESISGHIGTLTHERIEGEDNAVAVLRFKGGALGVIEGSTSVLPPMPRRLEIHGTQGTAILTGSALRIENADGSRKDSKEESHPELSAGAQKGFSAVPHQRQFEAIVEAIKKGTDPPVSGDEALKSLAIVLGIYESSRTQQPVYLSSG
ncbi:MAG: Gfo/Idh/MocA family oxidoreductase [Fidelibacterota bacterium]|nr:MAG: Gfo/Idh/MocA family oxidoreductase [Candidatus Neomarinimicrobiota bacterium]